MDIHTLARASALDLSALRDREDVSGAVDAPEPDLLVVSLHRSRPRFDYDPLADHAERLLASPLVAEAAGRGFAYLNLVPVGELPTLRSSGIEASFYIPRNIPWTSYPVLSDTLYSSGFRLYPDGYPKLVGVDVLRHAEVGRTGSSPRRGLTSASPFEAVGTAEIRELRRSVRTILLVADDSASVRTREWSRLAHDLVVRWFGPAASIVHDGCGGSASASPATARFDYSYRVNFDGIGMRLVRAALRAHPSDPSGYRPGKSSVPLAEMADRIETGLEHLNGHWVLDPLFLQYLMALDDECAVRDEPIPFGTLRRAGARIDGQGGFDGLVWSGTGIHPPVPIDFGRMERVVGAAAVLGLTSRSKKGARIAPAGRTLVAMIPKSMRDPDALCRWHAAPDNAATRQAMDAWIVRSFRALKRVANDLRGRP